MLSPKHEENPGKTGVLPMTAPLFLVAPDYNHSRGVGWWSGAARNRRNPHTGRDSGPGHRISRPRLQDRASLHHGLRPETDGGGGEDQLTPRLHQHVMAVDAAVGHAVQTNTTGDVEADSHEGLAVAAPASEGPGVGTTVAPALAITLPGERSPRPRPRKRMDSSGCPWFGNVAVAQASDW